VAVLGYSGRDTARLHPICASRLAFARQLAHGEQPVILSGWARRPAGRSEAELMREAWPSPRGQLVCDRTARSTADNAANVVAAADALGVSELVVVTSGWHRPRTRILFRAALRGQRVRLSRAPPGRDLPPSWPASSSASPSSRSSSCGSATVSGARSAAR